MHRSRPSQHSQAASPRSSDVFTVTSIGFLAFRDQYMSHFDPVLCRSFADRHEIVITANGNLHFRTVNIFLPACARAGHFRPRVVGPGAARTSPADIEAYLATPCAQAGWVGQGSGRLNDTGITFGGEPLVGNNTTCTSTDVNIAQQDCSQGRDANAAFNNSADGAAGFSFTKISNSGAALPATAVLDTGPGDWACTFDNVTGLMWEVKTASGQRSSTHTYSWYASDSTNNAGAAGNANTGTCFDVGQCDTEKFVQTVNAAGLCGHNDWRLPHRHELIGIVHYGKIASPLIDLDWFPSTPTQVFWSASPDAGDNTKAWGVLFLNGLATNAFRGNPLRVLLVRAGQ